MGTVGNGERERSVFQPCGNALSVFGLLLIVSIGRQFPQLGRGPKVGCRRAHLEQGFGKV